MTRHHKRNARPTKQVAMKGRETNPVRKGQVAQSSPVGRLVLRRAVAEPAAASSASILALQRSYGNRAVTGLIQAKLTVGPVGDAYEQEADRVADQVMSMPAPVVSLPANGMGQPAQRQTGEEKVLAKPLATSVTPLLQRQADSSFEVGPSLESRLAARRGGGSPLSDETRAFMESRLGADFSGVRVHADGEAVQMNRELNAQAFTHGQDIYMSAGKYSPRSDAGKRLLAHELTHVVQQSESRARASDVSTLRIQRALNFEPTNWADTQQINWVKGQDHPDHDNVLGFSGGGGTRLWVKTDESVVEARAAASLVASAAQVRSAKMGAHRKWKISTPQIREATPGDRTQIVKQVGKRKRLQPPATKPEKRQLTRNLLEAPVQVATHAGGVMGDQPVPEAQQPFQQDPGFRRALGYVGLLDIIMANFDRIIGMVGPQNWKVERPDPTLHLIDNLQRGFGFDISFDDWLQNPWIQLAKARDWDGMKARLMGYWVGFPEFGLIPANQQDAWANDFMAGMQEAWGDLGSVQQSLQAMPPDVTAFKRDVLIRRIRYVRGVAAQLQW